MAPLSARVTSLGCGLHQDVGRIAQHVFYMGRQSHHVRVTTMKELDQNSFHPLLKLPRQTCLSRSLNPPSCTAGEHSRKELSAIRRGAPAAFEEHLADAEVHLKLVKAHLAALAVAKLAKAGPPETAILPPPEPADSGIGTERVNVAPEERDRSPATRRGLRSGGGNPPRELPTLERGRTGCVLSAGVRIQQPTP
jgi:hypothetical protein